ncbi:SPFH domain-containing protein [Streptomyces sp. NPDC098789]|uniref:SPFH domain-containing protein n=1 Tax=Streptomyces sp. NPDC098789 TaxID=3366098 RepID=UPI00381E8390
MYPTRTTSTTGTMRIPPVPPPAPLTVRAQERAPAPAPTAEATRSQGRWTMPPVAPRAGLHTLAGPLPVPDPPRAEAHAFAEEPRPEPAAKPYGYAARPHPQPEERGPEAGPDPEEDRPLWEAVGPEPTAEEADAPEDTDAEADAGDTGWTWSEAVVAAGDPTRHEVPAARGETGTEAEVSAAPVEADPAPEPAMAGAGAGHGSGSGCGSAPAVAAAPAHVLDIAALPTPAADAPPAPEADRTLRTPAADAAPARASGAVPGPGAEPAPGPGAGAVPGTAPGAARPHAGGVWPPAPVPGGGRGVPGPGVAHVVAQAVARGMEEDTQDLPRVSLPGPGSAATEVPAGLPFRDGATGALRPSAGPRPRPAAPAAPGRRVPRGDERLRERRGPVLPGSVGLLVGGLALAGCAAVLWRAGALPAALVAGFGVTPRAYQGLRAYQWPPLAFLGIVALFALGGLGRGRTGHALVLTLFGRYRGTVRRTGLLWASPLLLRRRVDVRLRHWRSDPLPAVDSGGLALQVVVQVVWQIKDTARAALAVEDHIDYLAEQVESAMARVLSQLPADAFHEDAPTLRDAEAVGDALTRMLADETEAVGIEVYSAQPTRIEYAPEVAAAMRRRRVAALDAQHRDSVLTSVVDAVDDTVNRLTSRGLVELDDYERKALVKDLTVAFYTGRPE